jgi:hypothetical protein
MASSEISISVVSDRAVPQRVKKIRMTKTLMVASCSTGSNVHFNAFAPAGFSLRRAAEYLFRSGSLEQGDLY